MTHKESDKKHIQGNIAIHQLPAFRRRSKFITQIRKKKNTSTSIDPQNVLNAISQSTFSVGGGGGGKILGQWHKLVGGGVIFGYTHFRGGIHF